MGSWRAWCYSVNRRRRYSPRLTILQQLRRELRIVVNRWVAAELGQLCVTEAGQGNAAVVAAWYGQGAEVVGCYVHRSLLRLEKGL